MFLLELAAQGVKGCSPVTRAALKPGYVVLTPAGSGPVPFSALTVAVFHSEGRGEEAAFGAQPKAKVAYTLQGNDLAAYRLVRELGGPGALQQLNKATQKFETLTSDTLEMGQFIRAQIGVPQKSTFEYLFTLSAEQFPSRRPKKAPASQAAAKPGLSSLQPAQAAGDLGEAERNLEALQKELALANDIDKLQFQQDGIASQLFELEQKLQSTEGLKRALAQAEAEYANAPTPESTGLPKDIISRAERFPTLMQKRDEALARLEADREADAGAPAHIEPLWRDARFMGGLVMGAAFLAAGIWMRDGLVRYVALLDIPAFGFAALVALRWVDDLQGSQRAGRKEGMFAIRERKLQEEFEAEAQHVREAMRILGVESAEGVIEVLARKTALAERVDALRGELRHAESNAEYAGARKKYDRLKAESEALTRRMQQAAGGYIRDPREVEREIERVQKSIALARSGPAAERPADPTGDAAPAQGCEDPSPMLLSLAADLLQQDILAVAALIKDRCAQYVAALTDRRYSGVEWDGAGNASLLAAEGKLAVSAVPAKDADLYFLALKLTLVEKSSAHAKVPLLVDDVLQQVGDAKVPLVARMLKHLGTLTQVLHVTTQPAFTSMADATATL